MRYDLYSSLSCGASDFRGSYQKKTLIVVEGGGMQSTHKFDGDWLVVEKVHACPKAQPTTQVDHKSNGTPSKTTPNEPSPIFLPTRKCVPTMPLDVADWDDG